MRPTATRLAFTLVVLLALALSGCASSAATDAGAVLSEIYTSAALTVAAATHAATPTATLVPTSTSLPTSIPFSSSSAAPTAGTSVNSPSYAAGCDNAAYVNDVTISDGTELAPGENFVKTWTLANTGTCAWDENYSIRFVGGDEMDGSETEISETVAAGHDADISVSLMAPDDEGTYTGYWTLANKSGTAFGDQVYVQIVVSEDAAASTSTATPTPMTSTSTPISRSATPTLCTTATPSETPTDAPLGPPTATRSENPTSNPAAAPPLTPEVLSTETPYGQMHEK